MAKTFLVSINLNGNELQNAVMQPLATAPANPKYGQMYLNSTDNLIYFWNGTAWSAVGAVLSVNGQTGVVTLGKSDIGLGNVDNVQQYSASNPPPYPVTSVNGSTGDVTVSVPSASSATPKALGTAAAGTSTDYSRADHVHAKPTYSKSDVGLGNVDNTSDATKKTNFTGSIADGNTGFVTGDAAYDALALKLSLSGGTMTGNIAMGGNSITGLATPTNDGDAATKKFVDDSVAALGAVFTFKGTKATTSQLPLSGNKQGDVWLVSADNSEYVWTSSSATGTASDWEKLGVVVDLSGYAPLASPALTGTPTAPTAATGTNTTQIATTAFVQQEMSALSPVRSATGTISTSATTASVSYSGTFVNAYATMGGNIAVVDIAVGTTSVTFTTAAAPSAAVTCVVVYA